MEIAQTNTIEIVLNGERRQVPPGLSIDRLLVWLEIDPSRVAVEFNGAIVRKPAWPLRSTSPPDHRSKWCGSSAEGMAS